MRINELEIRIALQLPLHVKNKVIFLFNHLKITFLPIFNSLKKKKLCVFREKKKYKCNEMVNFFRVTPITYKLVSSLSMGFPWVTVCRHDH